MDTTSTATKTMERDIQRLGAAAWRVRESAYTIGPTKVGCAVLGTDGTVYAGCNVEHRFRSHDVHAEVNAITNMVSQGCRSLTFVFIAAQRERFTPCGACMDWIVQFAEAGDCVILAQHTPDGEVQRYTAKQLMPFYPK